MNIMPICTFKQPFDGVRGKFGTGLGPNVVVFDTPKNPGVVRSYVVPANPNSTAQQTVRANFGIAAAGFKALTAEQAAAWNDAAALYNQINRLGVAYRISGINLYMRINQYRKLFGVALTTTPPTDLVAPVATGDQGVIEVQQIDPTLVDITLNALSANAHGTLPQFLVIETTAAWTTAARKPRKSDFLAQIESELNSSIDIAAGQDSGTVTGIGWPTRTPYAVGDKVWFSVLGLSTQYAPAASPVQFQLTVTQGS